MPRVLCKVSTPPRDRRGSPMSTETRPEAPVNPASNGQAAEAPRPTSFAEEALRLRGKGAEEVRRMGAVDTADDQVEALFAARYQTTASPIHRAVWDAEVPRDLWTLPASVP